MSLSWDRIRDYTSRLREPRTRRIFYVVSALILAFFCLFPKPYVARVKLLPQDSGSGLGSMGGGLSSGGSGGLSSMGSGGGGLQSLSSLMGNRQSIEVYLVVGRSQDVLSDAVQRLHMVGRFWYPTAAWAQVWLAWKVDVNSLPGGIIEIDALDYDPAFAQQIAAGYAAAFKSRLLQLARQHIEQKKAVLADRLSKANVRLAQAEDALNKFQAFHKLAAPPAQLEAAVSRQAGLEAALQTKQVELGTALRFGTSRNIQVMTIQSEIASLRNQIAQTETSSRGSDAPNLTGMSEVSTQYIDLYRNLKFAQTVVDVYERYGEQLAAEDISMTGDADVQIIENAHVDPRRQFNIIAVGLLLALLVIVFFTECYLPMTRQGDASAVEP
jgi:hypothetical protein